MIKFIIMLFVFTGILAACGGEETTTEEAIPEPIGVSFDARGGHPVDPLEWQADENPPAMPVSERQGYDFDGWYTDADLTVPLSFETLRSGDTVLAYAAWTKLLNIHWVVEGDVVHSETMREGDTLALPDAPEIVGYAFTGWVDEFGEPLETPHIVKTDMTLYATFEAAVFTLTFETGLEEAGLEPLTLPYGTPLELPVPVSLSHVFVRWYEDDALTLPFERTNMPSSSMTLYARFVDLDGEAFTIEEIGLASLTEASLHPVQVIYSQAMPSMDEHFAITLLRDDSGTILMQTSQVFDIGAILTFDATIEYDGHDDDIPYIVAFDNLVQHGVEAVEYPSETVSLSQLSMLDLSDPTQWYRLFVVEDALMFTDDETTGLIDSISARKYLLYNVMYSDVYDETFAALASPVLSLGVLVLPDVPHLESILLYMEEVQVIEATPIDDAALLERFEMTLTNFYAQETFFVGQSLDFDAIESMFDITLDYEAVGEHADAYDQENNRFDYVRETTDVAFEMTIERGDASRTFVFSLQLETFPVTPIGEAATSSSLTFEGVVVAIGYRYVVLQDDTGMIAVEFFDDELFFDVGHHVVIGVWTNATDKPIRTAELNTLWAVIETGVSFTLPDAMIDGETLENVFAEEDYAVFTTLEGVLEQPNVWPYPYRLHVDGDVVYIRVSDEGVALSLHARVGEAVRLEGFVTDYALGYDPEGFVLFFFGGEEAIETVSDD